MANSATALSCAFIENDTGVFAVMTGALLPPVVTRTLFVSPERFPARSQAAAAT